MQLISSFLRALPQNQVSAICQEPSLEDPNFVPSGGNWESLQPTTCTLIAVWILPASEGQIARKQGLVALSICNCFAFKKPLPQLQQICAEIYTRKNPSIAFEATYKPRVLRPASTFFGADAVRSCSELCNFA